MDYWGSGKPGTATWLVLNNYPYGWVNDVYGSPTTQLGPVKSFGGFTSTGAQYDGKPVTIPSAAAPGYAYYVGPATTAGPVSPDVVPDLHAKPSKATVSRVPPCAQRHRPGQGPLWEQEGHRRST